MIFLSSLKQTYIIFLAKLKEPHFAPGPESSECQLFALDEIPYDSLAFSSMLVTLKLVGDCFWVLSIWFSFCLLRFDMYKVILLYLFSCLQYVEDVKAGRIKFHYGTINKR